MNDRPAVPNPRPDCSSHAPADSSGDKPKCARGWLFRAYAYLLSLSPVALVFSQMYPHIVLGVYRAARDPTESSLTVAPCLSGVNT